MSRYEKLRKAFDDSARTSPLVHLTTEQASALVDLIVDQSQVLQKIRLVKMDSAKMHIGHLVSGGRFLQPGGQNVELSDDKAYKAGLEMVTLQTKEFIGKFEIHDDEIKHNIEGAGLENTLIAHVAKKLRNEIVELLFYSNTAGNFGAGMDAFKITNGIFKQLEGKSGKVDASVGFKDTYASNDLFRKMLKSLPHQYRSESEFFVNNDILIDYNAQFDNSINRKDFLDKILAHSVNEIPGISFDENGETKALLTHPNNIILGVQIEDASMQFERERVPGKRKTVYHFSIEMDFAVELPQAAVVAEKIKSR